MEELQKSSFMMTTNMTSLAGLEGDMIGGEKKGEELYTLVVYIFKGEAGGTFLKHILKYSL